MSECAGRYALGFNGTDFGSERPSFQQFTQALADLGWRGGRNLRIEVRWAAGDGDRLRLFARNW